MSWLLRKQENGLENKKLIDCILQPGLFNTGANTIVSAPLFTISAALVTAFLHGQAPQVLTPITSISPSTPSNAHFFSFITFKSVVAVVFGNLLYGSPLSFIRSPKITLRLS